MVCLKTSMIKAEVTMVERSLLPTELQNCGMIKQEQIKAVASPRNHLERTIIRD